MLADLDAQLFVGREAELRLFKQWLRSDQPAPGLLYVWGPGGTGKSALLRAFARLAEAETRNVVSVDGRDVRPEPGEFAAALGGTTSAARDAGPSEREWLLGERLALWENAFVQAMLFTEAEVGRVWLDWRRPEDDLEVTRIWTEWVDNWLAAQLPLHIDRALDLQFLRQVLKHSGTRTRLARDADDRIVGFSTAIPLCGESLPLLRGHPGIGIQVEAAIHKLGGAGALSKTADDTTAWVFYNLAHTSSETEATQQALIRDVFGLFANGGAYLVSTPVPPYKALFQALGFERLADAQTNFWSAQEPEDALLLDLRQTGVEPWIEAIVAGQPPPRAFALSDVVSCLENEVLPHWHEDLRIAASALAMQLRPHEERASERARVVRARVTDTFQQLRQRTTPEQTLVLDVLEAAYLRKRGSHERAAEQLGISRSTFYRLLHRGVADLAAGIETMIRASTAT